MLSMSTSPGELVEVALPVMVDRDLAAPHNAPFSCMGETDTPKLTLKQLGPITEARWLQPRRMPNRNHTPFARHPEHGQCCRRTV